MNKILPKVLASCDMIYVMHSLTCIKTYNVAHIIMYIYIYIVLILLDSIIFDSIFIALYILFMCMTFMYILKESRQSEQNVWQFHHLLGGFIRIPEQSFVNNSFLARKP